METEAPLEPTTEERLEQTQALLAGAGKKLAYLNRLGQKLQRSGNPARKATGLEIEHILTMEDEQ